MPAVLSNRRERRRSRLGWKSLLASYKGQIVLERHFNGAPGRAGRQHELGVGRSSLISRSSHRGSRVARSRSVHQRIVDYFPDLAELLARHHLFGKILLTMPLGLESTSGRECWVHVRFVLRWLRHEYACSSTAWSSMPS